MLTTVKYYDLICYQLRNNLYSQLDNPLKEDIDQLSRDISNILTSGMKIQYQSLDILAQLFNLRIKAIKWLSKDSNFDYFEVLSEVSNQIEEIGGNKKLEVLKENIQFALRCNKRVVESLFRAGEHKDRLKIDFNQLPDISYQQFLASVAFAIPDDETAQKFTAWTNASLHIEFVMLAADIIRDENITVSEKTIDELSFLIADAAQEYSAFATEFGILKSRTGRPFFSNHNFDTEFINEQKAFADIGIEDLI